MAVRVTDSSQERREDPGERPPAPARSRTVDDMLDGIPQTAGVLAGLGGILGLVYGIGGAVMWLRFEHQGLPADQAVAMMPKADLLVVGMRVMIIPAIAAGLVLLGLASLRRSRARRYDELAGQRQNAKDPERRAELDRQLDRLRDLPNPFRAMPHHVRRPARLVAALLVFILFLTVPFSAGALAWPVMLGALVAYWVRLRGEAPIGSGRIFPAWRIAIAGVLAAAVISVARQTDPPVQLPSVRVVARDVPEVTGEQVASERLGDRDGAPVLELAGVLVTATDRQVAIGDPSSGKIVTVPRDSVDSIVVGTPLDQRAPPRSLLSRLTGSDAAWSVTPLELWCVNERYSWNRILDACQGHARIDAPAPWLRPDGTLAGVQVRCPEEATDDCRGFFTLRTSDPAPSDTRSSALRASTPPIEYAVARGSTVRIRLVVAREFVVDHWGADRDPVDVDLVLALDRRGDAELAVADSTLDVRRQRRPEAEPDTAADAENGSGEGEPDDPEPTPSGTASPEPTSETTPAAAAPASPPAPAPEVEEIPTVTATP